MRKSECNRQRPRVQARPRNGEISLFQRCLKMDASTADCIWQIAASIPEVGAIVKGKRNEWRASCARTCRIASLRRLIYQYDRANDDPLHVYFLRHPLGDRLVSNCSSEYPARYADDKAVGTGELASIAQADTTLQYESSDVRTFAFGENAGDTD